MGKHWLEKEREEREEELYGGRQTMKISHLFVFENLNVACFDENDQQIPILQKSLPVLFAEFAELCGYDAEGVIMETPTDKWRLIKDKVEGTWNRERV